MIDNPTLFFNYYIPSLFLLNSRSADEDIETQRQELMSGFDGALQKREHEFRLKLDEMSNSLLASDLKVQIITT